MKKGEMEKLIDGKAVAAAIVEELASEVEVFCAKHRPPKLTVIIVGEDPASQVYVGMKVKAAAKCGIESELIELPAETPAGDLLGRIDRLNADRSVDGLLVQLPLPGHIDEQKVIERVAPEKDVDGYHPLNLGKLAAEMPRFVSCTPMGISELLARYDVETEGKNAVIVGRSVNVGKPMALILSAKGKRGNATVTICHSRTADLPSITRKADILIAAAGKAEMITGDMVKDGVVVIDVGINRIDAPERKKGYRLVGDVEFETVYPKASLITPVPGGVGPMTVAMLMKSTLLAARWAMGEKDDGY